MERLRREAKLLFEKIDEGVATGASEMVIYDEAYASRAGIGRYGRMTIDPNGVTYHAAPTNIDRRCRYEFHDNSVFEYVKAWERGHVAVPPVSKLLHGEEWPQEKDCKTKSMYYYEKQLFDRLRGNQITLVNPTFSSMSALANVSSMHSPGFVTLTIDNREEQKWQADIDDFIGRSEGRLRRIVNRTVKGIAYLGSSMPRWFPETQWIRFVPSPFIIASQHFSGFKSEITDSGIYTTYERKRGELVRSWLSFSSSFFVYNPETVDHWFGLDPSWRVAYLESSEQMDLIETDDKFIFHKPFFLSEIGEWKKIGDLDLRVIGFEVTDVKGSGTYLSRRSRIKLPMGYSWKPFEGAGKYWITASSKKPVLDGTIHVEKDQERTLISLDGSEFVDLKKATLPFDSALLESRIEVVSEYPERGLPELQEERAVVWSNFGHQGNALRSIPSYKVDEKIFIDTTDLGKGTHLLAADKGKMTESLPGFSRFMSKRWAGRWTWNHWHLDADEGGYSINSGIDPQILEVMRKYDVYQNSSGVSTRYLAHVLNYPAAVVRAHCFKNKEIVMFRPAVGNLEEWAYIPCLKEKFPMAGLEISGRTWSDVYMLCRTSTGRKFDITGIQMGPFMDLLVNNGMRVSVKKDGIRQIMKVSNF